MPGTPYNPVEAFDRAIEEGKLSAAWAAATNAPHLTLDRALRLVLLLAEEEDPGAERAARRFVVRFTREHEPAMKQLRRLADALHCVIHDGFLGEDAKLALEDLARRLAEQRDVGRWDPPE